MVAVVSGNGLGLFNTSLTQLGSGLGGQAGIGQSRDSQYVNIATGNLMLQDQDECLSVRGFNTGFLRTYNSLGTVAGAGQDGFVTGYERRVVLGTGTFNTSGSTMTLNTGDGQSVVFNWTSAGIYTATGGDGAHDTLTWDGTARTWTFVEGSSRRQELYADHASATLLGRLTRIRDLKSDGTTLAQYDVIYDANNRVSEVRSIDGAGASADAILFGYNGSTTQLIAVATREGGVIKSQLWYEYDAYGRLASVTTDLTPTTEASVLTARAGNDVWNATASLNDGKLFRTTYTYTVASATDLRIASVTQGDGTVGSYTYESDGAGGYRVKTVTLGDTNSNDADGLGETVTFTYNPDNTPNTTDVVDSLNRKWTYKYDASKQLTEVDGPAIAGLRDVTTYQYDASGNVTQVKTVRGATVLSQMDYAYDTRGNQTWQWDAQGDAVQRFFNANNQIYADRSYTGLDPSHVGATTAPTGPLTTRYIYDTQNRLRFTWTALGEVTEYTYATSGNGIGQRASTRTYLGEVYNGPTTYTEADFIAWATTEQKTNSNLVEYSYDAKGRLYQTTAYAAVDSVTGDGTFDTATDITRYAYDAQGLLLQQVKVRGATRTLTGALAAGSEVIDYVYDGLGRLLSVLKRDSSRAPLTSRPDPITNPTGYAAWDAVTQLTTYAYSDSGKQIVVTLDTVDAVDATTGALITDQTRTQTQTFNAAHRLLSTVDTGTTLDVDSGISSTVTRASQWFYDSAGQLRATQDANGGRHYYFYDAKGLVAGEVDETGAITEYTRDGAGRVVDTIGYGTRLDTSAWLSGSTVTPTDIAAVRPGWSTDFSNLPITGLNTSFVDNATYANAIQFQSATGRLSFTTRYNATAIGPNVNRTSTHALTENASYRGEITTAASQTNTYLLFAVQNTQAIPAFRRAAIYFRNGNLYLNTHVNGVSTNTLIGTTANNTSYVVEARTRDGLIEYTVYVKGQDPSTGWTVSAEADASEWGVTKLVVSGYGDVNQTAGDALYLDNLSESDLGVRHNTRTYDAAGRLVTSTDAVGTVTTYTYDGAGRLLQTKTTDAAGTAATARTTRYFYDLDSRQVATLDATGYLTETIYDLAGRVVKTIRYATQCTPANWATGSLATLRPAPNAANDQTTRYFYNGRNLQVGALNAEGYLTEYVYDEANNQRAEKAYAKPLTAFIGGSETFAYLQAQAMLSPPAEPFRLTRRTFNGLGQLTTELNPEGTVTRYSYDDAGRLVRTEAAQGVSEIRENFRRYNVFDQLIGELSGKQAADATAALGKLPNDTSLNEAQLNSVYATYGTTHSYDLIGRRIESVDARGTDAEGNKTWYFYDSAGRQTFVVRGVAEDNAGVTGVANTWGEVTETRYSAFGEVLDRITYTGRISAGSRANVQAAIGTLAFVAASDTRRQYSYDTRGLLSRSIDAEGTVNRYTYTAFGQLDTEQRAVGTSAAVTIDHAYDNRGLETSRIDAFGSAVARTVSQAYDAFGRVIGQTDGRGITNNGGYTTTTYDRLGRQLTQTRKVVVEGGTRTETTSRIYDAFNRVLTETDALGGATSYIYSDANRSVSITTPEGIVVSSVRNRFGQTITATDGTGAITSYSYNKNGQLLQTTDSLGRISINEYDDVRSLLSATVDATGHRVELTYDAVGRVLSRVVDPGTGHLNLATSYAYDGQGRQVTTTDANGNVSQVTYDQEGRTLQVAVDPAGLNLLTSYSYDAQGRQVTVVEGAGRAAAETTNYAYDALGRRTSQIVDPGAGHLNLTTSFVYDANDNLIKRTDANGNVTRYTYDEANRLTFVVDPLGDVTRSSYDADGRLVATRQYATAISLSAGNITTLETATGAAGSALIAGMITLDNTRDAVTYRAYDPDGRVRFTIDALGAVSETTYDNAGRAIGSRNYANPIALDTAFRDKLIGKFVSGQSNAASTATDNDVVAKLTADNSLDQQSLRVFDAAGQLRYSLTRTGALAYAVTEYRFDAAGRTVAEVAYGVAIANPATLTVTGVVDALKAVGGLTSAGADVASLQRKTRYVYDNAGRLHFTIDDAGAVSERIYDGVGRVVEERSYQALISTSTAATESAVLAALDAAEQTSWSTDLSSLAVTGLYTDNVDQYGTALTYDTNNDWLVFRPSNSTTTAFPTVYRTQTHTPSENVVFGAELTTGASLSTTWFTFGVENNLTGADYRRTGFQITNGTLYKKELVGTTNTSTTLGTLAVNTTYTIEAHSREGGVDYFIYVKGSDKTTGFRFTVEETDKWDNIRLKLWSYTRPGTDGNPLIIDNLSESVAASRHTSTRYDAAGRVVAVTDGLGKTESYTYDAAGNMASRTDKNVNVWTYVYDDAGRQIEVHSPSVDVLSFDPSGNVVSTSQSLVTRLAYDALGNVTQRTEAYGTAAARTTSYTYDALGRQIKTTFPKAGSYSADTHMFAVSSAPAPYSQVGYDALGRAVTNRDVLGHTSYKTYDADGRLRFDVDAEGYLTEYGYDAFGQQTSLTRYATRLDLAGWTTGQALTVADIDSRKPAATDARTVQTDYDQRGLKCEVRLPSVAYINAAGTVVANPPGGTPTSRFEYNSYGQLVKESVLLEGTADQTGQSWAVTFHYYDDLGRQTMQVDAAGYVSTWTYDAVGQVTCTTEYARAISTASLTTTSKPGVPIKGDISTGYDRTTSYTYDALGRKASETMERLYQTADGNMGTRNVVTSSEFDADGNLTAMIVDGVRTELQYDALGRVVNVTEAARQVLVSNWQTLLANSASNTLATSSLYTTVPVSPYTTMEYDAFGNSVRVVRYAKGKVGTTVTSDAANDQISIKRYDFQGRLVMERDAVGNERYREYDAASKITKVWYRQDTGSGKRWRVEANYVYDLAGKQVQTKVTRQEEAVNGILTGTVYTDELERVHYNAFGEVTDKGNTENDATLVSDASATIKSYQHDNYDTAGRRIGSNAGIGASSTFYYNLAGQLLREVKPVYRDSVTGTVNSTTTYTLDKLGRAVRVSMPVTRDSVAGTGYASSRFDRWGNLLEVVDARGYSTISEYNDRNQVIHQLQATVKVVDEHGVESWIRPELRWFYDALGRQIGSQDANGNIRHDELDATGRVIRNFDALGNAIQHAYDAFDNDVAQQNPLGYLTFRNFDKVDRVASQGDFLLDDNGTARTKKALQTYTYDQAGNRITVTVAVTGTLSYTQRYDFDSRQLLLRSQSAAGVIGDFSYDNQGKKIRQADNLSLVANAPTWSDNEGDSARINEQTWDYDYFGRMTDHNDLSGLDFNYSYDTTSGMRTGQGTGTTTTTPTLDQNWRLSAGDEWYSPINLETINNSRVYKYYNNGLVAEVIDPSGIDYRFEYDANGNRTLEETTTVDGRGTQVHVITRIGFDSHNRVAHVTTDDVLTGQRTLDIQYDYDANGNRRRVVAQSGYSGYGSTIEAIDTADRPIQIADANLDNRTFKSGIAGSFTLRPTEVFQDPEGRPLSYSVQLVGNATWPSWLTATYSLATGLYTFSATTASSADLGDTFAIELKATDAATGASATTVFNVSVASNTGPTLLDSGTPTLNAKSGQALDLSLLAGNYFRDADIGDRLTLSINSVSPSAPWLGIDTSDVDVVHLTGLPTTPGMYTVYLKATDLTGASVVKTLTLKIDAPSAPVAVTSTVARTILIDRGFAYERELSQAFSDANGDTLTISAALDTGAPLPSWMTFQYEAGGAPPRLRLVGNVPDTTVAAGQVFRVVLTATDVDGLSATTTIVLTAATAPADAGPVVGTTILDQTGAAGVAMSFTVPADAFTDANGDSLVLQARVTPVSTFVDGGKQGAHYITTYPGFPTWLSFDSATRTFSGTPPMSSTVTSLSLQVMAIDPDGTYVHQDFQLSIAANGTTPPPPTTTDPAPNRQEYWFSYDAENRVQVANGHLENGQIMLGHQVLLGNNNFSTSYGLSYDAAGQAVARWQIDNLDGRASGLGFGWESNLWVMQSVYSQRGELRAEFYSRPVATTDGNTLYWGSGIQSTRTYDLAGRLVEQRNYFDASAPVATTYGSNQYVNTTGWLKNRTTYSYDADGRLTGQSEFGRVAGWQTAAWNLDGGNDAAMAARQINDVTTLSALSSSTQDYDDAGRLITRVYTNSAWAYTENNGLPAAFRHNFVSTYLARDSYLEATVSGSSDNTNFKASKSTSTYDLYGRRVAVVEETPMPSNASTLEKHARYFSYDATGGILTRRDGTISTSNTFDMGDVNLSRQNSNHYTYVNSQSVAHLTEAGKIDVLSGLTAFDSPSLGAGVVVVQAGDTLVAIAQRVYGNGSLWYVLAEANALDSDSALVVGTTLKTPPVKTTANDASTFKPYDPNSIIGQTTPNLPYMEPAKLHCQALANVIGTVVGIVVAYWVGFATHNQNLAAGAGAGARNLATQYASLMLNGEYDWGRLFKSQIYKTGGSSDDFYRTIYDPLANGAVGKVDYKSAAIDAVVAFGASYINAGWLKGAVTYAANYKLRKWAGYDVHWSNGGFAATVLTTPSSSGDTGSVVGGASGDMQADTSAMSATNSTSFDWTQVAIQAAQSVGRSAVQYGIQRAFGDDSAHWNNGMVLSDAFGNALGNAIVGKMESARVNRVAQRNQARMKPLIDKLSAELSERLSTTMNAEFESAMDRLAASQWEQTHARDKARLDAKLDAAGVAMDAKILAKFARDAEMARAQLARADAQRLAKIPVGVCTANDSGVTLEQWAANPEIYSQTPDFDSYFPKSGQDPYSPAAAVKRAYETGGQDGWKGPSSQDERDFFRKVYDGSVRASNAVGMLAPGLYLMPGLYEQAGDTWAGFEDLLNGHQGGTNPFTGNKLYGVEAWDARLLGVATIATGFIGGGEVTVERAVARDAMETAGAASLEPGSVGLSRNGSRTLMNQRLVSEVGEVACGPTSCAMIMNDQGLPVNVYNFAKQAGIDVDGTDVLGLTKALQQNGLSAARWQRGLTIDDLAASTSNGHAAIAQMDLANSSHFVVVDGITTRPGLAPGDLVAVRDPWKGTQYFVPVEDFSQRFTGWGILTNPK